MMIKKGETTKVLKQMRINSSHFCKHPMSRSKIRNKVILKSNQIKLSDTTFRIIFWHPSSDFMLMMDSGIAPQTSWWTIKKSHSNSESKECFLVSFDVCDR